MAMTMQIGVGLSLQEDPILAVKEAVRQARASIKKEKIDLAVVFSSSALAKAEMLKTISDLLGSTAIIGCSAAALISSQGIFQHGLLIMLLAFPEGITFNAACTKEISAKTSLIAGEELGEKLLHGFQTMRRNISVIFSDGEMKNGLNFIYGLQEKLGQSFPIVGASASDKLRFLKTYTYFNQEISSNAACGLLLGGKLIFGLGVKHGWKPLGKPRYVTKSAGNTIYEIDHKPAANIYEEYLTRNIAALTKELKHISMLYPIGIYLPGEEEYLLRNLVSIEKDGSLILQGDIPQGSLIRLMIGTKESCLAATKQAIEETQKGLFDQQADFIFVFNSLSRYSLLGRRAKEELEIIKAACGPDTPLVGIYTYGEQAPLKAIDYHGKAYFHNQTITILAIRGTN
jgi:hypothetical protein